MRPVPAIVVAGMALAAAACGSSGGGFIAPPDQVTLIDVQSQVLGPTCATSGCHGGTLPVLGLDLSSATVSAANLIGVASVELPDFDRVEPFNAADSYLYMKITADARIAGDPMPARGALNPADVTLIERWIDQGAQ